MIFRFAQPELLWLLLLVPVVALLSGHAGKAAAVRFPAIGLARQVSAFVRSRPGRFRGLLRVLTAIFLILALARPQFGSRTEEVESSGIDIVLAVDLSTSMWAHDFELDGQRVDRLTVVKRVVSDFIEERPNDRIGLVAFAGNPYLVSPITLNHDWLINNLDRLQIGLIEDGTAIGSAIGTSVNRLRGQASKSRIMILLTDGANNRGELSPLDAAEAAEAYNIKIYSIGAGQPGIVPFPQLDRDGEPLRDRMGRMRFHRARSQIDLETLKEISEATGGQFFHATNTDELQAIYDEIDQLEKTEIKLSYKSLYDEAFYWPLLAALVFLLLEILLNSTRFRRAP